MSDDQTFRTCFRVAGCCVQHPTGDDFAEDVAGGLQLATKLDWKSNVRLCILIADAPCHGRKYNSVIRDNYPKGCPKGRNPDKLVYQLQVLLGEKRGGSQGLPEGVTAALPPSRRGGLFTCTLEWLMRRVLRFRPQSSLPA